MAVEATKEVADCTGPNVIAGSLTPGLNINAIKPQSVLVDHPVNAIIAATAERPNCVGYRAAVTHIEKQPDNQSLENSRGAPIIRCRSSCADAASICF